jgi:hypothetical protein
MEIQTPSQSNLRLEEPMWFSATHFMVQDLKFIKQLLIAPIFKQNVPNLFEQLTRNLSQINDLSIKVSSFIKEVSEFRETLQHYPEENNPSIDEYYYGRRRHFMNDYNLLEADFLELKSKIFNYLSSVLLKNKP